MATQTKTITKTYYLGMPTDNFPKRTGLLEVRFISKGNPANNTSTLNIQMLMQILSNDSSNPSPGFIVEGSTSHTGVKSNITVNGVKYDFTFPAVEASSGWVDIANINVKETFTHDSNNNKSISFKGTLHITVAENSESIGYEWRLAETTIALVKINRAASVNCPATYIGDTAKITITKYIDGSVNDISCSFGGVEYPIAQATDAENLEWVVPNDFYNAIPNDKSGTANLIVETYDSSGNLLASNTVSFTVLVKEEISKPVINSFIVKNVNDDITALTGDTNIIVKGAGMIEYQADVSVRNAATITEQYITNGSKKISGMPQGVIDNPEDGTFTFTVVDSRGFIETAALNKSFVEYLKPTCHQEVEAELSGETSATVKLKIYGSYFNGTFGAVANTLKIEVRHTQNDGTMGDWVELTDGLIPVFNGNNYTLDVTISGFDYRQAYTFQSRATDKLNYVQSGQYTVKILPVFDWSETDINFNVPIGMNNTGTVLRHNAEANNTVLSGTGGHIYLRPNGTDDTYGETVIYPDGSVKFGGSVSFGDTKSDFVIETGTESMGTNGTWNWRKWASGKAECFGKRNFGSMAVTTAWGNLYRSAIFTQDLPSGLFVEIPEFISINMLSSNKGGWICKHENSNASASSTGAFIYVRPASATASSSYIGFYAIGRWKEEPYEVIEGTITNINGQDGLYINNVYYPFASEDNYGEEDAADCDYYVGAHTRVHVRNGEIIYLFY